MSSLALENVSFVYSAGTPFRMDAIKNVNISIHEGEFIAIIGHTGSGKSTLVQHMNGLLKPTSGKVFLNGTDIWAAPKHIREIRFKVGLVFQYPEHQLFDETVYKDIAFGPRNMGLDDDEIDARVTEAAEMVGIPKALLQKSPFDLSGGEKRRAAIAGVLAMKPEVLILDEPTAGLDPTGKKMILKQIQAYKRKYNATVIMVTHSMNDAAVLADRVLLLSRGEVLGFDTVAKTFGDVNHLKNIGLDIPEITEILHILNAKGISVNTDIFTVEAAAEELMRGCGKEASNA